jgi:hypothetical protein
VPNYKIDYSVVVHAPDPVAALDVARGRINSHDVPARVTSAGGVLISPREEAPPPDYVQARDTYGAKLPSRAAPIWMTEQDQPPPRVSRHTLQGWALLAALLVCLWLVGMGVIR